MKTTLLILSIALLGVFLDSPVMGQVNNSGAITQNLSLGMPEVALLVASATTINLNLTTATAGLAVKSSVADSSARLKISSVITSATRTLSAVVSAVPAGTSLTLQAQAPNSSFGGTAGTYSAAATLPTTGSVAIITGIGSCYSGIATDDGYHLKYSWSLLDPAPNYSNVRATGIRTTVVVTLTISAAV